VKKVRLLRVTPPLVPKIKEAVRALPGGPDNRVHGNDQNSSR